MYEISNPSDFINTIKNYNSTQRLELIEVLKEKLKLHNKENIPQGEYYPCVYLFEDLLIGKIKIFSISRYGTPNLFDNEIIRYDNYNTLFLTERKCIFDKFDCEGTIEKVIAGDFDNAIHVCKKHKYIANDFIDINVANISDLLLFYNDYTQLRMVGQTNNINKILLLKKIKIIMDLASKGRLKKFELSNNFKLYGIHFYEHKFIHENKNGWSF